MIPIEFIIIAPIFFLAIVLHECAHGWIALKLGDTTAKENGRLTLNPIKHVDPFGTVALPLMLYVFSILSGTSPIIIGWAKPVPINFARLYHPKRDMIWVGLAGPLTNILLAVTFSLVMRAVGEQGLFGQLLMYGVFINLLLATFNLLPIPPLDGSRIAMGLLPDRMAYSYSRIEPYGILIVFVLLSLGLFHRFVIPIVESLTSLLGVH